jgi:hypothetical protein
MSQNNTSNTANSFVVTPGTDVDIGAWLSSEAAASGQPYVVVLGLDRSEYTSGEAGITGTFSGNGQTSGFAGEGGDARVAVMTFTYDAASGQYKNTALGSLSRIDYTASASIGDMASISLYGASSTPDLSIITSDPYGYIFGTTVSNYLGSCSVVTSSAPSDVSSQATPGAIATTAQAEVGTVANSEGCWVLASTIADKAGAALPVASTAAGGGGQSNGEWEVAYDGSVQVDPNWVDNLQTGDIVDFVTASGGGHITTVAAGSGQNAQLIDNITYTSSGSIVNSAQDGDPNDVIVQPAHNQSSEFTDVNPADVVVYRLDTPTIKMTGSNNPSSMQPNGDIQLGKYLSGSDPFGNSISEYQVYSSFGTGLLDVDGQAVSATSAATAVSVSSLDDITLATRADPQDDAVTLRAFNGSYWGDWVTIAITPAMLAMDRMLGSIPSGTGKVIAVPEGGTISTTAGENTVLFAPGGGAVFSRGTDTIIGGAGADTVETFDNIADIVGGSGLLSVIAGAGTDFVMAGTGGLSFTGGGGFATVIGGGNPTTILGGSGGGDYFGGGNATITAGAGVADIEVGGNGDKLYASGANGVLFGTTGGDVLMSSASDNGHNVFFGANGTGTMTFITGGGNDLLALGQGTNNVKLGAGNDVIFDNANTTSVSTITAGSGSLSLALGGKSVDLIIAAGAPREFDLYNFVPGADKITLTGYSADQVASAVASQVQLNSGTQLHLGDGSVISLPGISGVQSSTFQ